MEDETLKEELTENLIKKLHYELKCGVFEDRANGYAIGDYKERPNMIGIYQMANKYDYLEALRSYRQGAGIEKLEILFEKERDVYLEKCEYFIEKRVLETAESICYNVPKQEMI